MIKYYRKKLFCLENLFFKVYNCNSWLVPVVNSMGQMYCSVIIAMLSTWKRET